MASGHEYRTRRPNTWLLRPTPQVKILLANPEPSTHGPTRTSDEVRQCAATRGAPDLIGSDCGAELKVHALASAFVEPCIPGRAFGASRNDG